jgi:hypothetical protein
LIQGCGKDSQLCDDASQHVATCFDTDPIPIPNCDQNTAETLLSMNCAQIESNAMNPSKSDELGGLWERIKDIMVKCDSFKGSFSDIDDLKDKKECSACDLKGACLSGFDLTAAILEPSFINGADLSDAILDKANMKEADLSRLPRLSGRPDATKLNDAQLKGANLEKTKLNGAMLYRADLSDAILRGADLTEDFTSLGSEIPTDLDYAILKGADLSGALIGAYTSFDNANVDGAIWVDGTIICEVTEGDPVDKCVCQSGSWGGCLLD